MPQRRRLAFSIFEEQAPRIRHKAVGFRAESVVTAEVTHIFHTPIGRVHAREAPPVHFQRERVEKRTTVERHKILRLPPARTNAQCVE